MKQQEHCHARLVSDIFHKRGFRTTIIRNVVFVYLNRQRVNRLEVLGIIKDEYLSIDSSQVIRNRYGEIEIRLEDDDDCYITPATTRPIETKYFEVK